MKANLRDAMLHSERDRQILMAEIERQNNQLDRSSPIKTGRMLLPQFLDYKSHFCSEHPVAKLADFFTNQYISRNGFQVDLLPTLCWNTNDCIW